MKMPKQGESSNQEANTMIQEIFPIIETMTNLIFQLICTNYRLWAMIMEVYLEAHELLK